jgi:hypothetical protein
MVRFDPGQGLLSWLVLPSNAAGLADEWLRGKSGFKHAMSGVFDSLCLGVVAMDVLSSGRASVQALASRQQVRLAALLKVAQQRSPLYRE